jgi:hypothetical protein
MAYVLTLSNPPTILFFAGVYGSVANLSGTGQSLLFAGGVLAGSMLWWMLLSAVFGRARHALNPKTIRAANAIAGVILCGFGLYGLIDVMLGAREKRAKPERCALSQERITEAPCRSRGLGLDYETEDGSG